MRAEDDVVCECGFEPSLQVLDGEGTVETKARGVLEGSPEAFEPGGGVDVLGGGEALADTEPPAAFGKIRPRNSPPRSVMRYFGAPKALAVAVRSRAILAASGFASQTCSARGTREKASKTPATWKTWPPRNERTR